MKYSLSLLLCLLLSIFVFETSFAQKKQEYTTKSKKAIKYFEGAKLFLGEQNTKDAIDYLGYAIEKDSNFIEAYLVLGDVYSNIKNTEQALFYYRKALLINQNFYPKLLYMVAKVELENGYYSDALLHYNTYYKRLDMDKTLKAEIERSVDRCVFAIDLVNNPVPFDLINIGNSINTASDEYANTLSTEENLLIFTRKQKKTDPTGTKFRMEEDFFSSVKSNDSIWNEAKRMGSKFNTNGNEGAMCISPDGKSLVFAADQREASNEPEFDLYISTKTDDTWSTPQNLGTAVNSEYWDSQPCLSSDGNTLYFVSKRPGGYGGSDIYKATRTAEGNFGNVQNLGSTINTSKNEMTPFIHQDGKTLYFVSQGHMGLGGFDIFMSKLNSNNKWEEPLNIGYPINSYKNEIGLIINSKGETAYISSERKNGFGGFDIYHFPLYAEAQPTAVNYMRGFVLDYETKKPLEANFELSDLTSNTTIIRSVSDAKNGSYLVVIPTKANLGLNVQKEGYLFYSENFEVEGQNNAENAFEKTIYLKKIEIGQSIVLKNVFFETGKYVLREESKMELEKLSVLMQKNPNLKIEIGGHTDNVGNDADNQVLSENRAKIVVEFIISKGIDKSRLTFKGYGETQFIDNNDTESARQNNRRIELKVIGF